MERETPAGDKRMRLRYDGVCRVCETALPAQTEAIYERSSKTVRCPTHEAAVAGPAAGPGPIDIGVPGASARREFERRKASREKRIRARNPRIGGLILALSDAPQSTTSWETGAVGEERVGQRLNELANDDLRVLHDRRVPGSRANIDHVVVTGNGVFVIDPKRYQGRPRLQVEGGLIRPRVERLMVGSRNCSKLVDGVLKQVALVESLVSEDVPVRGVLCFVEADWPLFGGAFATQGVDVLWPRKLYPLLEAAGPLDTGSVRETHERLARALPPA
ncbi:nuclease-related domain-containing protein [Aeromicrobium sp. Leaf350]|uniref:nuclease-related domain-containing protein n=1 Tax=Aeromicrobium sp. Leaf350 TaxID=2876565 RepID=UPI001E285644|nr:nuclease-related domain-containing protein [Aeromicrobium sp. Leaf350]